MKKYAMQFIEFNEFIKLLPHNYIKREILSKFLNGAQKTVIKCDYFTENILNKFDKAFNSRNYYICYEFKRGESSLFTAEHTQTVAEEYRKRQDVTKYIIYQSQKDNDALTELRQKRANLFNKPFDKKYHRLYNDYYFRADYYSQKTDKSGYTSFKQIKELKTKADNLRRQRQKAEADNFDATETTLKLQNYITKIKAMRFAPKDARLCDEAQTFIEGATNFIKKLKNKIYNNVGAIEARRAELYNFAQNIINDFENNNYYLSRFCWKFDKPNKKANRVTSNEIERLKKLYARGNFIENVAKNGKTILLTILPS